MNNTVFEYSIKTAKPVEESSFALDDRYAGSRIPAYVKMVASDVLALAAALMFATAVDFTFSPDIVATGAKHGVVLGLFGDPAALRYALLLPLLLGVFAYGGLYRRNSWEAGELRRIVLATAMVGTCDIALVMSGQTRIDDLWFSGAVWPAAAVAVVLFRMLLRVLPFGLAGEAQPVIVVGSGITSEEFLAGLRESRSGGVKVVQTLPLLWLSGLDEDEIRRRVGGIAEHFGVSPLRVRIVVAPSEDEIPAARALTEGLGTLGAPFSLLLPFPGLACGAVTFHAPLGSDFVLADVDRRRHPISARYVKRVIDVVIASCAIVLCAPLMVAIAVRLHAAGQSALFSQLRMGQNGRRFRCLKFRTMCPDASARLTQYLAENPAAKLEWDRHQKLADDPRVTPFGAFLRTTSLDELPQLFNVLAGDMSIVGPRPIVAPEVEGFENDRSYFQSPEYAAYDQCKPGITGLWQVSGRANTAHSERVRLDAWYFRNWSLWLDAMIVLKTVRAVLTRSGT